LAAAVSSDEIVALREALVDLTRLDPRKAAVVELRYFAGLSVEETATALDLSVATVGRQWRLARAWIHRELSGAGSPRRSDGP
jgi:RNA polymerase sigma factor (sigma-70 family)